MSFFDSMKSLLNPEAKQETVAESSHKASREPASYLLIIRHGRPDYGENPGNPRLLAGEAAYLQDRYQEFEDKLDQLDLQILSSPLSRARETAEAFQAALSPNAHLEIAEASDLGGEEAIQERLQKGQVLVVVGHEPYAGTWLRHFAGQYRAFDKGDAALIAIDNEGKGRLIKYLKAH
ncbi:MULTISPECIES: histidine phosphatase family protein [Aerococcus]|uniref:Histidine phosphatase family protein n=1 Tax=Aerococcus sanguinicola TaxID=119206 RepID=A0A5N1GHP7_9LACT|nr:MULTISPECIES: histidine phosphatase family protein [Aerococcus]KAA9300292.1 histidine phosphatase family protein [Aerococcus sanguinicola]MDK6370145.1 histidine phosphatase family protein [Aerococcus sp. UMB9870]MDK6680641.1 histidine phosphatase family protein [Aerococcus sp. UMB8608]MDK6687571.1 histidine phosphatase family protein [Aerococcus sp. UMB8623]MDK6940591.1 histidine phosphatase family protein [Aerococcus sp. UMB8487]